MRLRAIRVRFALAVLGLVGLAVPANATCTAFPYTLTNGNSADASQVMANFNYLLACVNSASPPGGPAGGDLSGTYPNPSVTSTHLASPQSVAQGGTGTATNTAHGVIVGQGTSPVTATTPSAAGYPLVSNGTTSDPSFQASGVTAGTYPNASITVGPGGLVTAASIGPVALQSGFFSSVSEGSIDFNAAVLACKTIQIQVYALETSTGNVTLNARIRNSGSDVTVSSYGWAWMQTNSGGTGVGDNSSGGDTATSIQLFTNLSYGGGPPASYFSVQLPIVNYGWPVMNFRGAFSHQNTHAFFVNGGGWFNSNSGLTGISFYASSGTVTFGYTIAGL